MSLSGVAVEALAVLGFAASLVGAVLRAATPLVFASLGGLVSDRAGTVNIALEGIMLVGAFFGVVAAAFAAAWLPGLPLWTYPWIGCAAGVLAGALLGLLLAVFHLELGADLIVAGVGINILASGLTVLLMAAWIGDKGSTSALASYPLPSIVWPFARGVPWLDALLNGDGGRGHHVLTYGAFLATALVAWTFHRTPFGLRLRAVGESPDAARQVGVSVPGTQYLALGLSGVLAGLGGVFLSMGYLTFFQADMAAGRGYLALAIVYLGARRPIGTALAALAFGGFAVMAAQLGYFAIPSQVVLMIPPLVTILALVAFSRRARWSRS